MSTFLVKVRTVSGAAFAYTALAVHSFDLIDAALERFGACSSVAAIRA
jgi:hypothetical protein